MSESDFDFDLSQSTCVDTPPKFLTFGKLLTYAYYLGPTMFSVLVSYIVSSFRLSTGHLAFLKSLNASHIIPSNGNITSNVNSIHSSTDSRSFVTWFRSIIGTYIWKSLFSTISGVVINFTLYSIVSAVSKNLRLSNRLSRKAKALGLSSGDRVGVVIINNNATGERNTVFRLAGTDFVLDSTDTNKLLKTLKKKRSLKKRSLKKKPVKKVK